MGEPKFRAWDGKMLIYDFILQSQGVFFDKYKACKETFCGCQEYGLERISRIDKKYIMQYIGLIDKNKKMIFQKDIFGGLLSGGYIDKCDKCYSFQYFCKDFGCMNCQGDVCWSEVVENILDGKSWVIGNIYEHKELLDEQPKG